MKMTSAVKSYKVQLRSRDLDDQGHVYHATYLTLLDQARTAFLRDLSIENPASYVLARLEIDYLEEITDLENEVEIVLSVQSVGTSSFHVQEKMFCGLNLKASSIAIVVPWNKQARRSRELSEVERSELLKNQNFEDAAS